MTGVQRFLVINRRLFFATLTIAAIVAQIIDLVHRGVFDAVNFFSFFTIESNVLIALVFLIGGLLKITNKNSDTYDLFRGAATLYMTITGIVFVTLLAGLQKEVQTTLPWVNTVLHYIMPIVALADWIFARPNKIPFKKALWWMTLPLLYLPYSLIRGHITDWYPYPFLDPSKAGGYLGVLGYSVGITLLAIGLIWLLSRVGKKAKA